jgi:hypothetical protein
MLWTFPGCPRMPGMPGMEAFKRAVSELLAGDLMAFGLEGQITGTTSSITVAWQETGRATATVERAVELLRSGDYKRGIRLSTMNRIAKALGEPLMSVIP